MWPFKKKEEKIKEEIFGTWFGRCIAYKNQSLEHPFYFGGGWMSEEDFLFASKEDDEMRTGFRNAGSGISGLDMNRYDEIIRDKSDLLHSSFRNYASTGTCYGIDLARYVQTGKGFMTTDEARQMFLSDYRSADDVLQKEKEVWKRYGRNMVETLSVICEYCGSRFETGHGWNCPQCGAPIKG